VASISRDSPVRNRSCSSIDRPLKHVHDPGEEPGDQVHMELMEQPGRGFESLLLQPAAGG